MALDHATRLKLFYLKQIELVRYLVKGIYIYFCFGCFFLLEGIGTRLNVCRVLSVINFCVASLDFYLKTANMIKLLAHSELQVILRQ